MSAFDDEFGLFGDEQGEEEERKSTLGARTITGGESVMDEIEPEDERPRGRRRDGGSSDASGGIASGAVPSAGGRRFRRDEPVKRDPLPAEIAHPRAVELLTFLAKKLVGKPDAVRVELLPDSRGLVLELEVDPDDLGKVIGRGGRVAQALRTIVRAGAEGRVTVEIVDSDAEEEDDDDREPPSSGAAAAAARPGEPTGDA